MKPGRTANIRINPADCMSCIDVIKKTGMNLQGASFTIIVSAALASMLESFRQNGIIPTRDGFEYNEIMKAYPMQDKSQRARALAITKTFDMASVQVPAANPVNPRKKLRFEELARKKNATPESMDSEDEAELQGLIFELNPL